MSYATNDVIVAKETITIDQNCTFKGLLSTGDSVNSICAIACTSTTRDPTANGMIVWDDTQGYRDWETEVAIVTGKQIGRAHV